jgi:hypothetical protein
VEVSFADFYSNMYRKFKFGKNAIHVSGILLVYGDPRMCMITGCCSLPGRRKVSDNVVRQNRNTCCLNTRFKKMGFERVNYENMA